MDIEKIGKFIAENRKLQNLTQSELGEKLGVAGKTVSRWENANYMPDVSLLLPLSEILNVSLNELLLGEKVENFRLINTDDIMLQEKLKKKRQLKKSLLIYTIINILLNLLLNILVIIIESKTINKTISLNTILYYLPGFSVTKFLCKTINFISVIIELIMIQYLIRKYFKNVSRLKLFGCLIVSASSLITMLAYYLILRYGYDLNSILFMIFHKSMFLSSIVYFICFNCISISFLISSSIIITYFYYYHNQFNNLPNIYVSKKINNLLVSN